MLMCSGRSELACLTSTPPWEDRSAAVVECANTTGCRSLGRCSRSMASSGAQTIGPDMGALAGALPQDRQAFAD
jgi:hypothetical protein